jgi:MSHA pilin protein MshA
MKKQQAGFTLIELVVVIVLLGILGAAATARFQNLNVAAADAAEQGVAAEIASASAINFANALATGAPAVAVTSGTDCATIAPTLLQQGALPANITVTGSLAGCTAAGDSVACTVTHSGGSATNATATVLCTG